jgi:hypothetical protein
MYRSKVALRITSTKPILMGIPRKCTGFERQKDVNLLHGLLVVPKEVAEDPLGHNPGP